MIVKKIYLDLSREVSYIGTLKRLQSPFGQRKNDQIDRSGFSVLVCNYSLVTVTGMFFIGKHGGRFVMLCNRNYSAILVTARENA
jgi:hypothetical protein